MSGKDGKDVAGEGGKRRRRKGGLRVPSDNVPRPSTGSEATAAEMNVKPAEDPRLAVSVAYALGEDENTERQAAAGAKGALPESRGEPAPHESVDIDVDDFEEEEGAKLAASSSQRPLISAPVSDSRAATIIDDSLAEKAAELDTAPVVRSPTEPASVPPMPSPTAAEASTAAPAGKAGKRANKQWPRVQTEALSDDELESMVIGDANNATQPLDVIEEIEDDDDDDDDDIPTKVSEVPALMAEADELEADEQAAGPSEPPSPPPPAKPHNPPLEAGGEDVVAADGATIPAAIAALEDRIGAPSAVPSAGESGEILADELIEELDEQDSDAVAVADAADVEKKVPPPAPSGSAQASPAATPKPRRKPKPWFEEIFDEDYLRTLPFLTPQTTQAEANFVIDSLAAEPGSQILDVGCGYGRHAMELAARGYHVVGLDSSLPLLLRGADEAQRRGLNINFVHGDMRELSFEAQFDGAYCLFSTFGYFDDETNKRTAQNISRALKPGARFVIEVLNRDYIIGDLPSRVWWEGDGCVVLEEVEFNYFSSRILSHRSVVFDDGHQLEQEISIRAYSLHELGKLLHAGGFRVIEISGGMHSRGRFFGGRSRDIVVVAERRSPSSSSTSAALDEPKRAQTEAGVGKV